MKRYKITYFLRPDAENIEVVISAKSYEDACIWAKGYRKESFGCVELEDKRVKVINAAGREIDFEAAVQMMDDEIRERLHAEGYETEQAFFAAYEAAHLAKYGEEWELSKDRPVW